MRVNITNFPALQPISNKGLEFTSPNKRKMRKSNSSFILNHRKSLSTYTSPSQMPQKNYSFKQNIQKMPKDSRCLKKHAQTYSTFALNKRTSFSHQIPKIEKIKTKIRIQDFELGLYRSQDRYGKIYPARHKKTGFICCIKQINKAEIRNNLQKFIKITKFQMFVLDKNIVQIYSIFEDMGYLYLVMEYIEEGAFLKKLKMHKGIKYESIEEHFLDVSCALKSIHTSHCLLRNLKPENIGTLYNVCKLYNFNDLCYPNQKSMRFSGTIEYSAPQLFNGQPYSYKSDIWNLGILVFEMITGSNPFKNKSKKQCIKKINSFSKDMKLPAQIPQRMLTMLQRMLFPSPKERITIYEIVGFLEQWQKIDFQN